MQTFTKLAVLVSLLVLGTSGLAAQEKVTGIGGFFFNSKDPAALAQWYKDNLGVELTPKTYQEPPWIQEKGPTVFQPFPEASAFFAPKHWMINFRVSDLDAMVAQLRTSKIQVTVDPQTYPNGRFAQLEDPEGNPIQLWQPK